MRLLEEILTLETEVDFGSQYGLQTFLKTQQVESLISSDTPT